ncbi:Mitochondrial import inner membrane translocase subunit tim16 [Mycena indigotica]|uniref:Mitochondrial import inner membrane translocase subunit TIM16 n=1 Tax=Mycena indigotica TaxID=2126181 RepID=A0A8H6TGJ8_9AGAR|nr:Mitochondrial import inner membrane translocase subunit tim16 [Mycena indigotica]KAF7315355.1 Mitochondrial import inner membrane translocase subunit tim16 [Mycena indigotica]
MSLPMRVVQICVATTRIVGKAFAEAGRQAIKNAKQSPQALSSDVGGVGNATSASRTDQLTRQHRMTLDEAQLILNVKNGETSDKILQHYEHLFKANSPPPQAKQQSPHSHYIQSKVVRARERLEAELDIVKEPPPEVGQDPPPPTS